MIFLMIAISKVQKGDAQRLIRVAEMFDDETLVSQLGLTSSKAYILTRVGRDDISHFSLSYYSLSIAEENLLRT